MELVFAGWPGIAIMLFYGALILGTGLFVYFKNKNKNITGSFSEYFLGGRSFGPIILFFTFLATQYSGNTIVGFAPKAYRLGFGWIQSVAFMVISVAGFLMFAPRLYPLAKKFNFVTPTDYLMFRFKSKLVSVMVTLIMMYALANFTLAMFVAIGQAVAGMTGDTIPYQLGVLFFVAIMVAYSWLGGMHSVAYVHLVQGITLTLGIVVLLVGTFMTYGDLVSASEYMITNHIEKIAVPSKDAINNWASVLILFGIGLPLYPHAIQRVFAADSVGTLKKSIKNMLWVPFVLVGSVMMVGLVAIKAMPGLDTLESEKLVGLLANGIAEQNAFFYTAMILFFGGIIAAIISTADSAILSLNSLISKDIYGKFINPTASDEKKIKVGKFATLAVVAILLVISWNPPATLYQILVIKFELLVQAFPAFVLSMYFKRFSSRPVFIGMLVGTIFAVTMSLTGMRTIMGFYSGLWGLLINMAICFAGSMFVKECPEKTKLQIEAIQSEAYKEAQPV